MSELKPYSCCFFGHRKIIETDELNVKLIDAVENLISKEEVHTFLFGSKSQFNTLCYNVVTNLKKKYSNIKRIYVRAEFPYIDDSYKNYLLQNYEDTYFPHNILNAGKAVYTERNYEMIDKSAFCICYYNENYTPPKRKNNRRDLIEHQTNSGTKLAYDYAVRKNLFIKNLF